MMLAAQLLAFASAAGLVLALGRVMRFRYGYTLEAEVLAARRRETLAASPVRQALDPFVIALRRPMAAFAPAGLRARVQHQLMQAGNPWGYTAEEQIAWAVAAALAVGGGLALATLALGAFSFIPPALGAILTYVTLMGELKRRGERRRIDLDRQLPYFLDLTALSMGAGATFLQACHSALERPNHGPLEEEIELMLREIEAGTPMAHALANITKRIETTELKQMIHAVKQGEELGTPLVKVFEQQAELNRYRRTKRGEQAAARLPNRLAVPTVFLMLAVFLLLFGPVIVQAVRGGLS